LLRVASNLVPSVSWIASIKSQMSSGVMRTMHSSVIGLSP
jgi:hypothetical protein